MSAESSFSAMRVSRVYLEQSKLTNDSSEYNLVQNLSAAPESHCAVDNFQWEISSWQFSVRNFQLKNIGEKFLANIFCFKGRFHKKNAEKGNQWLHLISWVRWGGDPVWGHQHLAFYAYLMAINWQTARKCHKTRIYGHRWLWWLQMAGSQWILVGSVWDTSRVVCWGHLDPPKLIPGASRGVRNGTKVP